MPLLLTQKIGSAILAIWKMEECEEELLSRLPNALSCRAELEQRNMALSRRIEYLSVRVLLHLLLPDSPLIAYLPSGKPYLLDSEYQISISHTKGYAALILDPTNPVAVDIEHYSPRVLRVLSKFMDERELASIDKGHELPYCLLSWSAKEALFKVMPEAEIDFKGQLHLAPFQVAAQGIIAAQETRSARNCTYQIHYLQHPDFVLTYIIDSDPG